MDLTNLHEIKSYPIRENTDILNILLKDRTTNKNIIWGTDSYKDMGKGYYPEDHITQESLKVRGKDIIKPRVEKDYEEQVDRTRVKGEVFTPSWVIKNKIDLIEKELLKLDLKKYISKKWLEITCGEAPYIVNRYDAVTGDYIGIDSRVGFLDRKLQRISKEVNNKDIWFSMALESYKATYGYEYQGDSLLIARENLLNSFIDYYVDKFSEIPGIEKIKSIAKIISYNIFQMDGLKYTVPILSKIKVEKTDVQLNFFTDMEKQEEQLEIVVNKGKDVEIMDWLEGKTIKFKNLLKCKGGKEKMKFDVVIGNPPYQDENKNRNRDDAIYNYFMDSSYAIGDKAILITPGRFLFDVGSTPKIWNKKMLSDNHLKILYYEPDSSKIFSNTDIKGGITITYRDKRKKFNAIDVFIPYKEIASVVEKISKVEEAAYGRFGELMYVQNKFELDVLYEDYPEFKKRLGSKGRERRLTSSIFTLIPEVFKNENIEENNIGIYGRENNERVYKYINSKYLEKHPNLNRWKVFIPAANGSGEFGEVLSTPVIGKPGTGHTQTFISIGSFNTEFESLACLNYIKTKFARAMLGVMKVTQNNKTKETWSKIPLQNFAPNSDIDWHKSITEIDQQLYKKYGLNEEEINFIESNVKEME